MKRPVILFVSLLAVFVGVAVVAAVAPPKVWLTTTSPNGTYTVRFKGDPTAPDVPGIEHEALFDLVRGDQELAHEVRIDSYDWFDSDFESYPEWVSESTLRLGYESYKSEPRGGLLTVVNTTDQPVLYLKVRAGDRVLMFDLPPRSSTKISVRHQGWSSWIAADGIFANGSKLPDNGTNFSHNDKIKDALRYCVTINETEVRIDSPVMDGYNREGTVPKAASCETAPPRR